MKKFVTLLFSLLALVHFSLIAQENLLSLLESENDSEEKVVATFKSTKVINAQTIETVKHKNLDFRIAHRFGNVGSKSNGGVHTLVGI